MTEENNTSTESTETTTEEQNVETQSAETQSTEQADTTSTSSAVSDSMAIEIPKEIETSDDSRPSLDDIVGEALSEGGLSEETLKLLDENDLKHVDMLVAGHKAIQEKNNEEVYSLVGGKDSYAELQEWARNTMGEKEQEAFNSALFSPNLEIAKLAVQGLQARYITANGKPPERIIEGGGTANDADRPYADRMDYIRETQLTEYKRDPEFRAKVEAKRNKSGF